MLRRRLLFASACLAATFVAPAGRAQTTGSSSGSTGSNSESINAGVPNPRRFLYQNGVCANCQATEVTSNPRPQNLNPEGVNFLDCEQNLRMDFTLVLSGFTAGDDATVQVWAGTVDCTQDTNLVSTAGVLHACWQVGSTYGPVLATTSQTIGESVYARDVLRYEAQPVNQTSTQVYSPSFNYSAQGESACHVQASDAAVPIDIYFIPVNSTFKAIGTAYKYALNTDLVAPPAPTVSSVQSGDTLLTVNWSAPGTDPDIVGYSVYSDPPASGSTTGGCSCGDTPGSGANSFIGSDAAFTPDVTVYRCMEGSADVELDGECEGDICSSPGDGPLDDALADSPAAADSDLEASMMPETGPVEASAPDAGAEAGKDAGVDAAAKDGGADAGDSGLPVNCNPINVGGSQNGSCASYNLTGHVFVVGGTTTVVTADGAVETVEASTTPVVTDEGGSSEGGVTLSGGGIAEIDPKYKAGEIDSITATSLTLTGLTNGNIYSVGVASIDGSGNVGPISTLQCAKPAPVNDYWKTYKLDGGGAGGCALEAGGGVQAGSVFGLGLFAAAAALVRRRRR